MRIVTTSVLISAIALSACGTIRDSRANPANWFSKAREASAAREANANPLLPVDNKIRLFGKKKGQDEIYTGKPVDQITSLVIERVPGGAVIRATGVTAVQGVYDVQLTPLNKDETPVDGVLTYRLEGVRPYYPQGVGSTHTRTVVVARSLTDQDLKGVRTIRVEAARNVQTSRR